ncbi:MAG TPA: ferrous iron transport protein B [Firmicutes bacterium]|nr:ferrous iron transport protein B [Bacillota bacterium]
MRTVALVGNPNVGKSVLFYHLTGNYAVVSNYPGTTVEVSQGRANLSGRTCIVYDTPGMYSFSPASEEEAVTRRLLWEVRPDLVVHVADAKNLPRMLPLTLELLAAGFTVILVLNMMDEAEKLGVRIRRAELSRRLGIPVLEAAFARGRGLTALRREMALCLLKGEAGGHVWREHPLAVKAGRCLTGTYPFTAAAVARLYLEQDREIQAAVAAAENRKVLADCLAPYASELAGRNAGFFAFWRYREAEKLLDGVFHSGNEKGAGGLADKLTLHPLGGLLLGAVVIYGGLFLFVGRFGAGYLVDLIEGQLLGEIILPGLTDRLSALITSPSVLALLTGEFGLVTLGVRYAVGIVMPIVGTYFFFFALLEDSGYLPRLAYWADACLKKLGLGGRAVIPLALGFGCGTMAVLVTRVLESRRERLIATFLLALAVPCSAQLGLIMALLSRETYALLLWAAVVGGMFLLAGGMLNLLLPGQPARFLLELPPLRRPALQAILQKTMARMRWYFAEVIPVFFAVSLVLWLLQQTGYLAVITSGLAPFLGRMGLPPALGRIFITGFFRRDYGAAGLFDLYREGVLTTGQLLVAAVVLSLFLPCLAQLAMMIRERGVVASGLIVCGVTLLAAVAGILLRILLHLPVL